MKVPFFKQGLININYASAIHEAVDAIISGSSFIVGGSFSHEFEAKFASYLGASYFSAVSNGLDALTLACEAIGLRPFDEVIVPCHTYIASWLAPLRIGCNLVVAPVRESDLLIDETKIEDLITENTKCILPVHLYGNSCDMNSLISLANKYNIYLIEDAAQSHGSCFDQKKIGAFGDLTCFSFYPTKNLGALGEAGGISTNSYDLNEKIRSLRNYGRDMVDGAYNQYLGSNKRCDEIQAAFLSKKLDSLDDIKSKRLELLDLYRNNLNVQLIKYQSTSSPHLAVLRLKSKKYRDALAQYLKDSGIGSAIHYKVPCNSQPFINPQQIKISDSVSLQAQDIANTILSLPLSEVHTPEEIKFVCNTVNSFLKCQSDL